MWEWNDDTVRALRLRDEQRRQRDHDESVRFMRGIIFGLLVSSILWAVLIVTALLAL